jgi:hypothetical protein
MMDSNAAKRVDFEIKGGQLLISVRAGMVYGKEMIYSDADAVAELRSTTSFIYTFI